MSESSQKVVGLGLLLFLDSIVISAGGWVYWLVISKVTSSVVIGQATSIYSFIMVLTLVTQLGLEYPLLKGNAGDRSRVFGSSILIEGTLTVAFVPFLIVFGYATFEWFKADLMLVSVLLFTLTPIWFISKFSLLNISNVKSVLIIDCVSTLIRFLTGYVLVLAGFGPMAILLSSLAQQFLMTIATLLVARRFVGISTPTLYLIKVIMKDALVNALAKFARMFIVSLSVLLLAALGVSASSIGVFYIALMISVGAGGLMASVAFMVIPVSSMKKKDLSSGPVRLGLSLSTPIIVILLVAPGNILGFLGKEYAAGAEVLFILALSILPSSIVLGAISRFNNLQKSKLILHIGIIQISVFLASFFLLVPAYGTVGASLAILIAFSASAILSCVYWGSKELRNIFPSVAAVLSGWLCGLMLVKVGTLPILFTLTITCIVTLGVVSSLKGLSLTELRAVVTSFTRNNST